MTRKVIFVKFHVLQFSAFHQSTYHLLNIIFYHKRNFFEPNLLYFNLEPCYIILKDNMAPLYRQRPTHRMQLRSCCHVHSPFRTSIGLLDLLDKSNAIVYYTIRKIKTIHFKVIQLVTAVNSFLSAVVAVKISILFSFFKERSLRHSIFLCFLYISPFILLTNFVLNQTILLLGLNLAISFSSNL